MSASLPIVKSFLLSSPIQNAYGEKFVVDVNKQVFNAGDNMVIYGTGAPDDVLSVRIYDPVGITAKINTVQIDHDGFFRENIFRWPEPSKNLPYGTYSIEMASAKGADYSQQLYITFAEPAQNPRGGGGGTDPSNSSNAPHFLSVKLDAPTEIEFGKSFRIYVQITFDGALVNSDDPSALLGTSHVHSGNTTIPLSGSFKKLHEGLYFADVVLPKEGSYIVHAIAFNKGYLSHDSKVISASAATLGTLQESINNLDGRLTRADNELKDLQVGLDQTRSTINDTKVSINDSVNQARGSMSQELDSARGAVEQLRDASGQMNSIILPVMGLISVIIALQISLFARIRASYR
jgi:hypothetical protein